MCWGQNLTCTILVVIKEKIAQELFKEKKQRDNTIEASECVKLKDTKKRVVTRLSKKSINRKIYGFFLEKRL